jgi:hypothetical protein
MREQFVALLSHLLISNLRAVRAPVLERRGRRSCHGGAHPAWQRRSVAIAVVVPRLLSSSRSGALFFET